LGKAHALLDTHAFLWWNNADAALGARAREAIADPTNVVFVSAATAWEIAIKRRSGKLDAPGNVAQWIRDNDFAELEISVEHAVLSAELSHHHRDPFDRILIAQAKIAGLTLVSSSDANAAKYDVGILDAST
jgi:PIN domain nuclease of toxin-antitoxin system